MPITHSKLFHMTIYPLYIMPFLPLKHYTRLGAFVPPVQNMVASQVGCKQGSERLRNIMRRRLLPMPIPLSCVCVPNAFFLFTSHHILVLDPDMKMAYFKKHWSVELQNKVLKSAEEIVR
jgi:hypothetical protein